MSEPIKWNRNEEIAILLHQRWRPKHWETHEYHGIKIALGLTYNGKALAMCRN